MSDMDYDTVPQLRTEAFLNVGGHAWPTEAGQPVVALRSDDSDFVVIVPSDDHFILAGGTLACRMLLGDDRTTSSTPPLLYHSRQGSPAVLTEPSPYTAAQAALAEIRAVSGLTNEEISPLAGVSRRSIQTWVAGGAISARKEQRLRALLDAIRQLATDTPAKTRDRLFSHAPGDVRPYDLLAECRWDSAVDLAAGRRRDDIAPAAPQAQDLSAQLDRHEGRIELPLERLDRRFSGRLQR